MASLVNMLPWRSVLGKKAFMLLTLASIGGAAYYLGRLGGPQLVEAQTPGVNPPNLLHHGTANVGDSDYSRRIVATIYGNQPISREELGEYLIARFGAERLDFLVNRKIVEKACQARGITVTDAEIQAQLQADVRALGGPTMSEKIFADQVLRKFNKTLFEWKEDVVRPKLLLAKYCKPYVKVEEADIQKTYEARYGPKVKCRLIVLAEDDRRKDLIWKEVQESDDKFKEYAKTQMIPALAANAGEASAIHKHFGDERIEREAFKMKPGDVSHCIQLKDRTWLIMKCDEHIPADPKRGYVDVRLELFKELEEVKLAQLIAETFQRLRKEASPHLYLTAQQRQNNLDQRTHEELQPVSGGAPPSTATTPPLK